MGIGGFDLDFWWELALLVVIVLLGRWLEMRALGSAQGALDALAALLPGESRTVLRSTGDPVVAWIVLSPAAGAVLMSASTIVVALNAQLLRRLKLNPAAVG